MSSNVAAAILLNLLRISYLRSKEEDTENVDKKIATLQTLTLTLKHVFILLSAFSYNLEE